MGENGIKRVGCEILSTGMPAKVPAQIPSIWKEQAVANVQTRRWLEAVVYGLTHHVWVDGDQEEERLRREVKKHLSEVIQTMRSAKWGKPEILFNPETKKPAGGAFVRDPTPQIVVNPVVLGTDGNMENIDGSFVPLRCRVLPHEGVHMVFNYPQIFDRTHLRSQRDEDHVVKTIEWYYFSKCSPLNTVTEIPSNIIKLFKSCKEASLRDTRTTNGVAMVGIDFNNDGVADIAKLARASYVIPSVPWEEYLASGESDAPHIVDPHGKVEAGDMVPANDLKQEWKELMIPDNVTVWYASWFLYNRFWRNKAIRFFNDDRSMSFVPGDKVGSREDSVARVIEGVVVFYDYKDQQVWGSSHLDFGEDPKNYLGGKRFVSINDVVWVTAQGQPLDMQQVVKMAKADEKVSEGTAKTAEGEMAKLLRQGRQQLQNIPPDQEVQRRKIILDLTKEFPYQKDLPVGWETSVLFSLGLKPEYLDNPTTNGKSAMKID